MQKLLPLAQAQSQLTLLLASQAGMKEYAADWLKEAKTVTRDAGGRFASKASDISRSVGNLSQELQRYAQDPELAKHAVNTKLITLAGRGLETLVAKSPQFADQLTGLMLGIDAKEARDKLADLYAEVNPGLPNAIKPDPLKEFADDLKSGKRNPKELVKDLGRVFELAGYKYNKLIDDLNHVESESEAIKLLGKIAATAIPISAYLAATLTPEVAIGLLVGDTLTTILASAAATQAVSFAANKAMDKMDVQNPVVRLGVDLAIGVGVGTAVSAGANQLKKRIIIEQKKLWEEGFKDELQKIVDESLDASTKPLQIKLNSHYRLN